VKAGIFSAGLFSSDAAPGRSSEALQKHFVFRVQEGDRAVRGNHWKFRHLRTLSRLQHA